uniref:RING-type E3 ubiquitin transferase n=1 Tax=Spermophilus dauricus TaxID=99837 RepID=A0A8C9PTF5_SPEDA
LDNLLFLQSLAVMKRIGDLLRCGIFFGYFNIAMIIPQCSHNYCSLCIRKFLSYKTQCPTCWEKTSGNAKLNYNAKLFYKLTQNHQSHVRQGNYEEISQGKTTGV